MSYNSSQYAARLIYDRAIREACGKVPADEPSQCHQPVTKVKQKEKTNEGTARNPNGNRAG